MKKLFSCLLLVVVLCLCSTLLVACKTNEASDKSSNKISLTTENFDEYFAYNIVKDINIPDNIDYVSRGTITLEYYPVKDITTDNCTVTIQLSFAGNSYYFVSNLDKEETARISSNGEFKVSFDVFTKTHWPLQPKDSDLIITIVATNGDLILNL